MRLDVAKKPAKKPAAKRPPGRPSDYRPEIGDVICGLLAEGKALAHICQLEGMPHVSTVFRWMRLHDEFREAYTRAREDQADFLADEMQVIADEDPQLLSAGDEDGKGAILRVDSAFEQWRRTRIDTRKWIASKLKPKRYGDRISQEVSGPDGKPLAPVAPIIKLTVKGPA